MTQSCVLIASFAFAVVSAQVPAKTLALGEQLAKDLERRDGRTDNPPLLRYTQQIADRLAAAAGGNAFEVRFTDSWEQYANLLPHNVLYISSGFFTRLQSEAELAGLLAHQLAHMPKTAPLTQTDAKIPLIVPSCVLAAPSWPMMRADERRESEMVATQRAAEMLKASGYDPSAVLDLLSKLAYEHPVWSRAILPEDLLKLRTILESDAPPKDGFAIDSSEFVRQHANVVAAIRQAAGHSTTPTLHRR